VSAPKSPFVGLAAFTPRMSAYFTGRERFALTLAGAVLRSRITVLYGQSGSGKSSVLGAALPQVLRATLRLVAVEEEMPAFAGVGVVDGSLHAESTDNTISRPLLSLREKGPAGPTISPSAPLGSVQHSPFRLLNFRRWHPGFESRLYRAAAAKLAAPAESGLAAAVAAWGRRQKAPVILVLDQFEEFLLYHPKPTETTFVQDLGILVADPDIEARVLLSLREDSLASLDALRAVIPGILASPVQLRPLDRAAAGQAIRKPVAKWSEERFGDPKAVVVEDSLVDSLLDQVQETGALMLSAEPSQPSTANLVQLPLLQLALERLWEEEKRAEPPVLRAETLRRLDGAVGIAQQHLRKTMEELPTPQRAVAIRLFRYLVTATGGKQARRADDLAREIDADRIAAERTFFGKIGSHVRHAAAKIGAKVRGLRGLEGGPVGPEATRAAVRDTLQKLAVGKTRILRTQLDPRGQGSLFELDHDALAVPVLDWVQEARIDEARRRQALNAFVFTFLALCMAAAIVLYLFYSTAIARKEQAQLQESKYISIFSRRATQGGDTMTGMLAALAALPENPAKPDRPYSNFAAAALLDARLRNREKYDLIGHKGSIASVAFSPDGRRVVTGSEDKTARVWDLSGPTPVATILEGHSERVTSVAFSPDGRRVVTGSEDNTARVWDLSGPTPVATILEGHSKPVTSVAFSPDGRRVVTGSEDNMARVWDLSGTIPVVTVLEGHRNFVTSVAFSSSGRRVVTGSKDSTARVWDLSGATPVVIPLDGHRGAVTSVAFNSDGQRVVTGSEDNTARVWDLSGVAPVATPLVRHTGAVTGVAFSPSGRRVVTGSKDGTALVWDLSGASPTFTPLQGDRGAVTVVAFSPDGWRVLTGFGDNTALVWDLSPEFPEATPLEGHRGAIAGAVFSPDGWRVVTGSADYTARVWDVSGMIPIGTVLKGHRDWISGVALSRDGRLAVTGSYDHTARVWNLTGPTPIATVLEGHRDWVTSVAFSADYRRVATGSADKTARVWDLSGATPVSTPLVGHSGAVTSVAFSPDGLRVVTGSADKTARVWDLSGATPVSTSLVGHSGAVTSVAFSPDGLRVVTGSADKTARVWDLSSVSPVVPPLEGHSGAVASVAFTPDGRHAMTGDDRTARVWDLSTLPPIATPLIQYRQDATNVASSLEGRRVTAGSPNETTHDGDFSGAVAVALPVEGHHNPVTSVAFGPDGRLATGSDDKTAWVWDLSGGSPAATVLEGHRGGVTSVAFSSDGRHVASGSQDNTARVWDTPPIKDLIPLARAALTRCLTILQRDELGLPVRARAGQDTERIEPPPCPRLEH
jgi:WD40 repeat protein